MLDIYYFVVRCQATKKWKGKENTLKSERKIARRNHDYGILTIDTGRERVEPRCNLRERAGGKEGENMKVNVRGPRCSGLTNSVNDCEQNHSANERLHSSKWPGIYQSCQNSF